MLSYSFLFFNKNFLFRKGTLKLLEKKWPYLPFLQLEMKNGYNRRLCPWWGVREEGQQSPCLHSCHFPLYKEVSHPHFPYPDAVFTLLLIEDLQPLLFSLSEDTEHRWVVEWHGVHTMSKESAFHLP